MIPDPSHHIQTLQSQPASKVEEKRRKERQKWELCRLWCSGGCDSHGHGASLRGAPSVCAAKAKTSRGETGRCARSKGKLCVPVWEMKAGRRKLGHAWRLREPALEDAGSAGGGSRGRVGKKGAADGAPGKQRKIKRSERCSPPPKEKKKAPTHGGKQRNAQNCKKRKRQRERR